MGFLLHIPGATATVGAVYPTLAAAVAAREEAWRGSWGGQALVIVDEAAGVTIRPCAGCRGRGWNDVDEGGAAHALECETCHGAGHLGPA